VDPGQTLGWTDEEVARRWLAAFPGALRDAKTVEQEERAVLSLISTPERMEKIRERLGSLSWFMRALNEPIARMANKEDGCGGRLVSRPREFHPQPLSEPDVTLSRHPAPIIEPLVSPPSASKQRAPALLRLHVAARHSWPTSGHACAGISAYPRALTCD